MKDKLKVLIPLAIVVPIFPIVYAYAYELVALAVIVSLFVQPSGR